MIQWKDCDFIQTCLLHKIKDVFSSLKWRRLTKNLMNCAPGIAKELQNCIALKFLRLLDVGNYILVVKFVILYMVVWLSDWAIRSHYSYWFGGFS